MKHPITLKEIAKELGISISTVSKSLKNYSEISQETRDKVQAFAKLYNYQPNNIALSLKNRKSFAIGVIIPEVVHHFFASVIKGIETVAISKGYTIIIGVSNEHLDKEKASIKTLSSGTVDGFIISLSEETLHNQDYSHLNVISNYNIPMVMFDRVTEQIECDKVIIDDKPVSFNAVQHLINTGHSKIAFVTTEDYLSVGKLRTDGYYEALQSNNITIDEHLVTKIHDQSELETKVKKLITMNTFDAIVAVNETYAATCIKILEKHNIKSPDDVSIISLSNGLISLYTSPSISAVNQNGYLMGQKSAELLINRIESKESLPVTTEIVPTELILRDSVKNRN
ncbi:MAG: LacI family DNA-binding transcriptional regulator [Flavobacteriales bacterium]|nr:LacI family DNA-binding transcriptional regulator [Flavobacteriales bacterium]